MIRRTFLGCCGTFFAALAAPVFATENTFDVQTPDLSIVNISSYAGIGYQAGAFPDNPPSPNTIYLGSNDQASGTVTLLPGNYLVSARRQVFGLGNTGFNVSLGGLHATRDPAQPDDPSTEGTFAVGLYPGYFTATGPVAVNLNSAGSGVARFNTLSFTPTGDTFFDENTADLALSGAGTGRFAMTVPPTTVNSLLNSQGYNAIGISPGGSATGTVHLLAGQKYLVYAGRQLSENGNDVAFNLLLNGTLFKRVTGLAPGAAGANTIGETLLGTYTPASGSVKVLVNLPGSRAARVDYIRFALPLPERIAALGRAIVLKGFALDALEVNGVSFPSGGDFPTFVLYDHDGNQRSVHPGSGFFGEIHSQRVENSFVVTYSSPEFSAEVTYAIQPDGTFLISAKPLQENTLKIRAVTDGGALVSIPSTATGAEDTGFLLRPFSGGEQIKFPANREVRSDTQGQSWEYNAGFVGLGLQQTGLIVRSPQFGALWTAGTGNIRDVYSLYVSASLDFRPRRDQPGNYRFPDISLCEDKLDLQVIPVGDVNGDGQFNWVDLGVDYRKRFIRRNQHLDARLVGSLVGKIDVSAPYPNPLKYDALIEQVRAIDFTPQVWWIVGAHNPPEYDFIAPPHTPAPHPGHNGAGGYDYFRFREDARQAGATVSIYEVFDDTSELNAEEWGRVPVRFTEYDGPMSTFWTTLPDGTRYYSYSKALRPVLADGSFMEEFRAHLERWRATPDDTWHWDVFTTVGGRADFHPQRAVTHGVDYRDRIEVLKQIQQLGIHMASEGLQEGMSEFCDHAWTTRAHLNFVSQFSNGVGLPLLPVLFQGTTYYATPAAPAWGLLMGGTTGYEATFLDVPAIRQGYFAHVPYWSKICDRTVRNMVKTTNGWRVTYDQGGTLNVNLTALTFTLSIDGETWTPARTPVNSYGYYGVLVNGTYVAMRDPQSQPPAAPSGLTAVGGEGKATLRWTAVTGASGYNVKVGLSQGGPYTVLASAISGTDYVDENLLNGTTYYYVVSALGPGGESANSAEASATPRTLPRPLAASSCISHGSRGSFALPASVTVGEGAAEPIAIECRGSDYFELKVMFDKPIESFQGEISSGIAQLGVSSISGSTVTMPLTGLADAQIVTVALKNIVATDGSRRAEVRAALQMLKGDAKGDGTVSSSDINLIRAAIGTNVSESNFRRDINADGEITMADVDAARGALSGPKK